MKPIRQKNRLKRWWRISRNWVVMGNSSKIPLRKWAAMKIDLLRKTTDQVLSIETKKKQRNRNQRVVSSIVSRRGNKKKLQANHMLSKLRGIMNYRKKSSRLWIMMLRKLTNLMRRWGKFIWLRVCKRPIKEASMGKVFLKERALFTSETVLILVESSGMARLMEKVSISSKTEVFIRGNSEIRCSTEEVKWLITN